MDGILLVHKEAGMTSHDVVGKVRKIYNTKKVGHCGTLDPDATGVLVVAINKATKAIQFLDKSSKQYIATISLGEATDTYDASGKITASKEFTGVAQEEVIRVLKNFIGEQQQIPPIYSAIKVNGKKLYQYARADETVAIKPRLIEITNIKMLSINGNEIEIKVDCSKGTYIRSLCVDIGKALGYPAHMKKLIRTRAGAFSLDQCHYLSDIDVNTTPLISITMALQEYPQIRLADPTVVYHGKKIASNRQELTAICDNDGEIIAMYGPDQPGWLKNVRGLW